MQIFALGTGSASLGALSMLVFALGTVPLMFALGAASTLISRRFTTVMLKFGGAFVLILAFIMISNGLSFSGTQVLAKTGGAATAIASGNEQIVTSGITPRSYQPITVKQGIPVVWTIKVNADDLNGCNSAIVIPEYKIRKKLMPGDNVIRFTPEKSGIITFSCWMGMIHSSIMVTNGRSLNQESVSPVTSFAGGGCCQGKATAFSYGGSCCQRPLSRISDNDAQGQLPWQR
jgi:hypothetical protein